MTGSFPCPHCEAMYPVKPVLVGRPVRCTQCKNVFRLREDGIADKVGGGDEEAEGAGAAVQAPPGQPSAAERAAAARVGSGPPSASLEAVGVDAGSEPPDRRSKTSRLEARREEMRRSMAANLSDAASKALESESARRSSEAAKRESGKQAGSVGDISPAVLTDYGNDEARNNRRWAVGLVACLLVGLMVGWVSLVVGPERRALQVFTEPDPTWEPTTRIQSQQRRAWLFDRTMPVILNLDEAELGRDYRIEMEPARALFQGRLADHVLMPGHGLWVGEDRVAAARAALADAPSGLCPVRTLAQHGIQAVPTYALDDLLVEGGMNDQHAALVRYLVEGTTGLDGRNWIREQFTEGTVPRALEIVEFHGDDGRRLTKEGQNRYGSEEGLTYRGRLMRFDGWSGPMGNKADVSQWHLLDVQVAHHGGSFPGGRGW